MSPSYGGGGIITCGGTPLRQTGFPSTQSIANAENNARPGPVRGSIYCGHVLRCARRTTSGSECEPDNFRPAVSRASSRLITEWRVDGKYESPLSTTRVTRLRRHCFLMRWWKLPSYVDSTAIQPPFASHSTAIRLRCNHSTTYFMTVDKPAAT